MFCDKIRENVGFDHRNEVEWKWRGVRPQIHGGDHHRHIMVMYDPGRTSAYPSHPPERGFRFHCLGGGDEVGNVGIMMEDPTGTKLLLDYGLAPTDPPRYPNEAPRVTDAVITHSHIDHLGMAPWLAAQHGTRLHGSSLTLSLIHI